MKITTPTIVPVNQKDAEKYRRQFGLPARLAGQDRRQDGLFSYRNTPVVLIKMIFFSLQVVRILAKEIHPASCKNSQRSHLMVAFDHLAKLPSNSGVKVDHDRIAFSF